MKKNNKVGKTFSEKSQIINILSVANAINGDNCWMTTREIVNAANKIGWTTPMDDINRKASSHPYSKVLSMMTDVTNSTYYSESIHWRKSKGKGRKIEFRIS